MSALHKVLLVDPVMVSHSLLYYQAALASTDFEETLFTVLTAAETDEQRKRVTEFTRSQPRMALRLLEINPFDSRPRWEKWRSFGRSMRATERILRTESFDLVAYLSMDPALMFFALPIFRPVFRAHFAARVAGTLFWDNGLRPPILNTTRARLRAVADRWVLRRALASGALRKAAFLDPWCAEQAATRFKSKICGNGVDPVFFEPCDRATARARFGLTPNNFVFLLFGLLSDRKAVVESLAMLREAPLPKDKTVILVAGPAELDIQARLKEEVSATAGKYRVIRDDRFIQQSEIAPYFAASDCVLCVYKDFSGSSNVLLQGAVHGSSAVVSSGGVMEDAVRRHNFGEVANWDDPKLFTEAVCRLANLNGTGRLAQAERARHYAASMDARRFMSQFL
jgi:hypothetical protein